MANWLYRQTLRFSRDYYFDELSAEFTADNRQLLEDDLADNAAESCFATRYRQF